VMAAVAKQLTDEEIQSLGSYLQGLHPRADEAPEGTVVAAAPAAPVAPAPAPAAAEAPPAAAPGAAAEPQTAR
jgi:hypothetical protein